MFTTLARTYFRATGLSPTRFQGEIPQSWYREELRTQPPRVRWEDWK